MSQVQLINLSIIDLKCIISDVVKEEIHKFPKSESPPSEKKRLYGDRAGGGHIGCTPLTMAKLRKSGKVRYYTIGRRFYYYAHELDEDLRGGKRRFGELRGNRKGASK